MYESPKLVSIGTINAGYGHGPMTMGLCVANVNAAANANAAVSVNVAAAVNVAVAAAVGVVVAVAGFVINHYSPHGKGDPRRGGNQESLRGCDRRTEAP